jgi:Mce-associated membrane protein
MKMSTNTIGDAVDEDSPVAGESADAADNSRHRFRTTAARAVVFGLLPAIALLLACGLGWLKWWESGNRAAEAASAESVKVATDTTIALLSYQPDTVDKELVSARDRLTGTFRDSYTSLTNDVVIPGAKQKHISAVATVPAATAVSSTKGHAVVLVMVNQTTVVGTDAPTQTATSIKVTLDKVDGQWLVSDFSPI